MKQFTVDYLYEIGLESAQRSLILPYSRYLGSKI